MCNIVQLLQIYRESALLYAAGIESKDIKDVIVIDYQYTHRSIGYMYSKFTYF